MANQAKARLKLGTGFGGAGLPTVSERRPGDGRGSQFQGNCRRCGKWGRRAVDCQVPQKGVASLEERSSQFDSSYVFSSASVLYPAAPSTSGGTFSPEAHVVSQEPVWNYPVMKAKQLQQGAFSTLVLIDSAAYGHVCPLDFAQEAQYTEFDRSEPQGSCS